MATGRCLCGAVRFEVHGPLEQVLICHCQECRRWTGHVSATAASRRADLSIIEPRGLQWVPSPRSDTRARRGFCRECGSSLFWDSPEHERSASQPEHSTRRPGSASSATGTSHKPATITTCPKMAYHTTNEAARANSPNSRQNDSNRTLPRGSVTIPTPCA